jgi:hypothetical protein
MFYPFEYSIVARDPKKASGPLSGPSTDRETMLSNFFLMRELLHAVELKFVRKLRPIRLWFRP